MSDKISHSTDSVQDSVMVDITANPAPLGLMGFWYDHCFIEPS